MSVLLESVSDTLIPADPTIEAALIRRGWEQSRPANWRLQSGRGECRLEEIEHRDRWRQFHLSGGATRRSANGQVLEDNAGLFGPVKLVALQDGGPICRVDVPETLAAAGAHGVYGVNELQIVDAAAIWTTAVTAFATGEHEAANSDASLENDAVDDLKQAGWSASLDDGQLHVHLQLRGVYRQLASERNAQTGVKLGTELVELTGLHDDCLRAMKLVANEVNARLPLVRLALAGPAERRAIRAEVGFGAALIPGTFLLWSLHAFETMAARCVRELEALRDPQLAGLVLATAAARKSAV